MRLFGVFVGIDVYADKRISPLSYAKADAENFYHAVSSTLPTKEVKLWLITDQQATKRKIFEIIGERLSRVVSVTDIVLLYFAGHGSPETSGSIDTVSRYIITHDTEYDNIFTTAIDMERDLLRLIERVSANLVVTVLDTCFSGQAGGRTFQGPFLSKSKENWREGFKLSSLNLGEGRVILTSSDSDEVAVEDPVLKHGVFTHFLLKVLTDSSASEPWISLNALYERVSQSVHDYTMGHQNPVMIGRVRMARLPLLRSKDRR